MGFTVPDAHLLALHAHQGQVDEHGRDHYLAHLRPVAEALGVTIAMNGGPATVYGPRAFAAFREFAEEADPQGG